MYRHYFFSAWLYPPCCTVVVPLPNLVELSQGPSANPHGDAGHAPLVHHVAEQRLCGRGGSSVRSQVPWAPVAAL